MDKYFKSPAQRPIPQSIENILGILSDVDDNICEEDSLICDEEDVFGNTNIEKLKKVTLTGTILFSPSILAEENMFNITLLGDDRPYILKLNRKMHNRSTTVLKSGERYLFQCEKEQEQEQEHYYVKRYANLSSSRNVPQEPNHASSFERKCREKEPNFPLLDFCFFGVAHNINNSKSQITFDMNYDITRHCVIDHKMCNIKLDRIKNGNKYYMSGILAGDTFYVRDGLDLGNGKSFESLSKIKKAEFNDRFSRLNEQARNEILEIYSTCEKYPKIDTLCVPAFRDMHMYDLKYNMCQEHYPPDVQSVIEKTLRNQKLKNFRVCMFILPKEESKRTDHLRE